MKQLTIRALTLILTFVLLLTLAACGGESTATGTQEAPAQSGEAVTADQQASPSIWDHATYSENKSFGEGQKEVLVEVKAEEKSITFTLHTDKENLADALLEHKLVEGEDSQFGLYIKKVNGISADYDADGYYWSLSQNGTALMTGASDTEIAGGEHFELTRTKG